MSKMLSECLKVIHQSCTEERIIERITNDSRLCDEKTLYCGEKYQKDAFDRHAYIVEGKYLGELLRFFYGDLSSHYFVIGITGTSGKTSLSYLLIDVLKAMGHRCIRLGSGQNDFMDESRESKNTTMSLEDNIKVFQDHIGKCDVIIMEVSSHAIDQNRIAFIQFDRLFYTNILLDHLDYHLTFSHYKATKLKLIHYLKKEGKILMHYDHRLLHEIFCHTRNVISYGKKGKFCVSAMCSGFEGSSIQIKDIFFVTHLLGEHQMMNLLGVLAMLEDMNVDLNEVKEIVSHLHNREGRMEHFLVLKRHIVIDYAHTPDALMEVCNFLRKQCDKKLICVMGCGGNRDRKKRPLMMEIAAFFCDVVIVTEDNNRDEDFDLIIEEMKAEKYENVEVEEKREIAVERAFNLSNERDIILLAGKGNEKFLIAKGVKTPYNDKACILKYERG